jgi:hypothetical protein
MAYGARAGATLLFMASGCYLNVEIAPSRYTWGSWLYVEAWNKSFGTSRDHFLFGRLGWCEQLVKNSMCRLPPTAYGARSGATLVEQLAQDSFNSLRRARGRIRT